MRMPATEDHPTVLDFHPLANLFPLMQGAEFDDLVADIRAYGQHDDIVTLGNKVLDGRNRYRACAAAGIAPRLVPFRLEQHGDDPLAFVLSKNLKRRHLNESQRAMAAADIANRGHGRPAAKPANLPDWRPHVSQTDAARMLAISERTLRTAKVVRDTACPEVVHAVRQGKLAVSVAAQAARLPPEQQRLVVIEAEAGRANAVRQVVKREARAQRMEALGATQRALPDKKFGVILADPEWNRSTWSEAGMDRHAANHYSVSSDEIIASRPVASIAAPDCILGLWCTDPHRGVDVMRAWGFEPKSYFAWIKDIVEVQAREPGAMLRSGDQLAVVGVAGNGYWNRDRDELLLIGTRGNPPCPAAMQGESVWFARRPPRPDAARPWHSAKPDCSYEWFERHFPGLPKIELNARRRRDGWMPWGNEIEEIPTN